MKLLYIAHKLTEGDPNNREIVEKNVEDYLIWCARAMDEGYSVASWVINHETHIRGLTQYSYEEYIELDLALLRRSDELWVATDPAGSRGVRIEMECAKRHGIPIYEVWKEFK
jgi:hypothetical protein